MKKFLLALLLLATQAWAQPAVRVQGTVTTDELSKDREWVLIQGNMISNIFGDGNACANIVDMDSSGMIPTKGFTRLRFRVRVQPPNTAGQAAQQFCTTNYQVLAAALDSLFCINFGVQLRTNTTSVWDSTAGMVRVDWKRPTAVGSWQTDSVGSMLDVSRTLGNLPDYGEFVYVHPIYAGAITTPTFAGRNFQNYTREFDLMGRDGEPIVADYLGVRWRTIAQYSDANTPTELPSGGHSAKPMFVTVDLLGSRQ
jgi:hypothetical protein